VTTKSIYPDTFAGDDALMIETAEQFSRERVVPKAEEIDRQADGLMPGLIGEAGQLGLCGIDSPEAYGGLGLPKNLAARMLEFLSLNPSFSVTYGITSGISQVGLALFGTDDQKSRWLPALTAGESIGAYCLSEPNSGSDALSATTVAETTADGFLLTGTKMWISNAQWADTFLVMAKVDGNTSRRSLSPVRLPDSPSNVKNTKWASRALPRLESRWIEYLCLPTTSSTRLERGIRWLLMPSISADSS